MPSSLFSFLLSLGLLINGAITFKANPEANSSIQEQYVLIEKGQYASCLQFEVQNSQGEKVDLPESVGFAMDCCPNTPAISPDSKQMAYFQEQKVKLYEFESGKIIELETLQQECDGISDFLWNENSSLLLYVTIDLENEQGPTEFRGKLLSGSTVKNQWNIPAKVNYSCDGFCNSIPMTDFWIQDAATIGYLTYRSTPYDVSGYQYEKFIKLF